LTKATLYLLITFREPGPRWHPVNGPPLTREEAKAAVQEEWKKGHQTRMVPAKDTDNFFEDMACATSTPSQ